MAIILNQKIQLAFLPTPIETLNRLTTYLDGPTLLVKRDDQTGLAFGGNKTRKLEYLLADALEQNADTLVTSGAIQSNHCRQTAAVAAKLGFSCELLLKGKIPQTLNGNLFLNYLLGANVRWTDDDISINALINLTDQLKQQNKKPYIIPLGGSNPIGSLGYVNAMIELNRQMKETGLNIDHIVFATCSGGTHAGLVVGARLTNFKGIIHGIQIAKLDFLPSPYEKHLANLANETAKLINLDTSFSESDFTVNANYLGNGYAVITQTEKNAIDLMAKKEGILLDPVYSGRAFGGLIDLVNKKIFKKNETVLFWHTGGQPALFAYPNSNFISGF